MDVEKTIEFILEQQARADAWHAEYLKLLKENEERWAKNDERWAKNEARFDKFDKRLNAITKLVQTGMRMLVKIETAQKELAESQKVTDRKLQAFIDSMRKGRNGH